MSSGRGSSSFLGRAVPGLASGPPWTDARGKKRDFDKSNQQVLFGEGPDEETTRNRLLMEEVPRYLRHWMNKGRPVLGGMVENVIQCRKWDQWDRWLGEIKALGYKVRVIAFNSMHARPVHSLAARNPAAGSLLAALDVHPRVAMQILRRSQIAVTMEIYTEATSEATREALRKLGKTLDRGQAEPAGDAPAH